MDLTARASRIIAAQGRAVTLKRETPGGPDGFGGTLPGTWTDYPATAATARYGEELAAIAGGLIEVGDLRLFMAVDVAVTPQVDDRVTPRARPIAWCASRLSARRASSLLRHAGAA